MRRRLSIPVHGLRMRTGTAPSLPLSVERIDNEVAFCEPHRHAFTQFILIEAGSGSHHIDSDDLPIKPGQVHVTAPGQVHAWQADPGLQCTAVMFFADMLDSVNPISERLRELLLVGSAPIAVTGSETRLSFLLEMIDASASFESAQHLLLAFLYDCVNALPEPHDHLLRSTLTEAFLRLTLEQPNARHTVACAAERLGVSVGYLTEQVTADMGATPGQLMRSSVTREARRLLSGTALSAAQISHTLGFSEASYFSRFFRREVGCTPTAYRAQDSCRYGH